MLAGLSHTEYKVITLGYLEDIAKILNEPQVIVKTFDETFKILQYLADAKAVELVPIDESLGVYKIKKVNYGN